MRPNETRQEPFKAASHPTRVTHALKGSFSPIARRQRERAESPIAPPQPRAKRSDALFFFDCVLAGQTFAPAFSPSIARCRNRARAPLVKNKTGGGRMTLYIPSFVFQRAADEGGLKAQLHRAAQGKAQRRPGFLIACWRGRHSRPVRAELIGWSTTIRQPTIITPYHRPRRAIILGHSLILLPSA